ATKGRRLRTIRPEDNAISVFSVAFVPGETELLATGSLRGIKLWDPTTGQFSSELPRSPDVPESHQTFSMAFSRDGRLAAAGANDGSVHLYRKSPRGWTISKARDKHTSAVYSLQWSPSDEMLVSAGYDGNVKIWRLDANSALRVDRTLSSST